MLLATALPFLVVTFPPCTDLPQHVAQVRLVGEALGGASPTYQIQWLAPNNLVYALIGALWLVLPPLLVGRATILVLALSWSWAAAWLAARRQRPAEVMLLAATLSFPLALSWGLLNFLIGWPVFLVWIGLTADLPSEKLPLPRVAMLMGLAILLYASHLLWFALGVLWLAMVSIAQRPPLRSLAVRAAVLMPPVVLAAIWYPSFMAVRRAYNLSAFWFVAPWARLAPDYLLETALGGPPGTARIVVGCVLLLWAILAIVSRRRELAATTDRRLLLAAAPLALLALCAPDQYLNTILFSKRWMPCAVILALLALPAPRLSLRMRQLVAGSLLVALSLATTFEWLTYQRDDLSGLREAIAAAPPGTRVLGLDFVRTTPNAAGRPFLQMMAYLQVVKGCTLNFSFAEHGSSIVSLRHPSLPPWTAGLEWHAEYVQRSDFKYFDVVLANGEERIHQRLAQLPELEPVTGPGRWRLYRVRSP
jgi:hypothetical protein